MSVFWVEHLEPPFAFEFSGIALLFSVVSKRWEKEPMAKAMYGSKAGVLKKKKKSQTKSWRAQPSCLTASAARPSRQVKALCVHTAPEI